MTENHKFFSIAKSDGQTTAYDSLLLSLLITSHDILNLFFFLRRWLRYRKKKTKTIKKKLNAKYTCSAFVKRKAFRVREKEKCQNTEQYIFQII